VRLEQERTLVDRHALTGEHAIQNGLDINGHSLNEVSHAKTQRRKESS
jgi:hypothetical protein